MKTALLIFFIWLTGFLISYVIYCRAIRYKGTANVFDLIEGDQTVFEREPLEKLVEQGELMSYVHEGFWQCMDNVREKEMLEKLWAS